MPSVAGAVAAAELVAVAVVSVAAAAEAEAEGSCAADFGFHRFGAISRGTAAGCIAPGEAALLTSSLLKKVFGGAYEQH